MSDEWQEVLGTNPHNKRIYIGAKKRLKNRRRNRLARKSRQINRRNK